MKLVMMATMKKIIIFLVAFVVCFIIHQCGHIIAAIAFHSFKNIRIFQIGVEIQLVKTVMTDLQTFLYSISGSILTLLFSLVFLVLSKNIAELKHRWLRRFLVNLTGILLFMDPIHLSVFYIFIGKGDMEGLALVVPEIIIVIIFGIIFLINLLLFVKRILPLYFQENHKYYPNFSYNKFFNLLILKK